jgi:hypothetical protein
VSCRARRVLAGILLGVAAVVGVWPHTGSAVAASSATTTTPVTTTAPSPLHVSMVGDSVMLGARDDLLASLPGDQVTVDAVENRSLLGAVSLVAPVASAMGDVVVLALGYNDAADPAVFRGRIDSMMGALAPVPAVVWFTQRVFRPDRAPMNQELTAAQQRYPNLQVVDWDATVAAHPDYVYADGIHLTPPGRTAFAALARVAVDGYRVTRQAPVTTTATSAPVTDAQDTVVAAGDEASSDTGRRVLLALVIGAGALAILVMAAAVTRRLAPNPGSHAARHW